MRYNANSSETEYYVIFYYKSESQLIEMPNRSRAA